MGDGVCFVLNELLNRDLIQQKYKFEAPDFSRVEVEEEDNNGDNGADGTEEVVTEKRRGVSMGSMSDVAEDEGLDDHDDINQPKKHSIHSTNNISNSTSATSTYSDHFRTGHKRVNGEQVPDIEENRIQEAVLDSVEWAKEVDRVGPMLTELQRNFEKTQQASPLTIHCTKNTFLTSI